MKDNQKYFGKIKESITNLIFIKNDSSEIDKFANKNRQPKSKMAETKKDMEQHLMRKSLTMNWLTEPEVLN